MCTIINIRNKPILLEQDLTVYKILQKNFKSTFTDYLYIPGKKNEEILAIESLPIKGAVFDFLEYAALYNFWLSIDTKNENLRSITQGFHFAFHKERLVPNLNSTDSRKDYFLAEFTVPAGSLVYKGIDDSLGVSNCIILNVEQPYLTNHKNSKP